MSYIAKFNPYSMDNETILTVATGRKKILNQVLKILIDNLKSSSSQQHLIIKGARGMGKSFFLKYLKLNFEAKNVFNNCDFLLLPEEQNNIHSPADLIKLILSQLKGETGEHLTSLWEEPDEVWQIELNNLKDYIKQQKDFHGNYLLTVVVENFNDFLTNIQNNTKTRKVYESRFRHLLEKMENLCIIAAMPAVNSDIDSNYNSRLFHAFKKIQLQKWTEEDYFKYFEKRKEIKIKEGESYSKKQMASMKAKLKALSKFTGGSPRIAVVLTNLLLNDDVISTVKTLFGLIDDLTPYYQDITSSIPTKSLILFDTLIRKGENLSQSEIAEIVGASQSKISKAFLWLKDNGYIVGKKRKNSPAYSYQVADRIHVLYYQLREIHHNQSITPIWLLSDFLVAFYQEKELLNYANRYLAEQPGREANDIAKLYLLSSGHQKEDLPKLNKSEEWLAYINKLPKKDQKEIANQKKERTPEESIIYYQEQYDINVKSNNKCLQVWNLGQIAWNYRILDKFDKAIVFHLKALKILELEKNITEQAWNLEQLAWNYKELKEYDKAIDFHTKALMLEVENKNISNQAWNLGQIAWNYRKLDKFNKAIDFHTKALKLRVQEKNISEQVWNLGLIAWNYKELKAYNKAIDFHTKALKLCKQEIYISSQAWNLGQIGVNYILLDKWEKAIQLVNSKFIFNELIFKEFGDAIVFTDKNLSVSEAFKVGRRLLSILKESKDWLDINRSLSHLFTNLLEMEINNTLFIDLCEEAKTIFTGADTQIIINAAIHTIKYIETGKDVSYLENLNPDMALAIKAIVDEGKL